MTFNTTNNFIIGGGLSGLIAGVISNCNVISKNVGGQFSSNNCFGPRYFHYSDHMGIFLKYTLNLDTPTKKISVGYFDCAKKFFVPKGEAFIKNYSYATRGHYNITPSTMNNSESTFEVFDIDETVLLDTLKQRVTVIPHNVTKVDIYNNILYLDNSEKLYFNNLISTLHVDILYKLIFGKKFNNSVFKSRSKVFLSVDFIKQLSNNTLQTKNNISPKLKNILKFCYFIEYSDFDFIYVIHAKQFCGENITRFFKKNDEWYVEITVDNDDVKRFREIETIAKSKLSILPKCLIVSDANLENLNRVYFAGRYAEWNHSRRLHNIFSKINSITRMSHWSDNV